jgi:hypothetical protein
LPPPDRRPAPRRDRAAKAGVCAQGPPRWYSGDNGHARHSSLPAQRWREREFPAPIDPRRRPGAR